MPAMLGCSTVCPNCKHQFTCCAPPPVPTCCTTRRSLHVLSGGGLVSPLSPHSAPFSFDLLALMQPQPPPMAQSETDLARLSDAVKALRRSGWYYDGLTHVKSDELLKDTKIGTFLVRNSSDPRFLFSLSVQTECGPKSVRLYYVNGYFQLDAQPHLQGIMPQFSGVIELIQHYAKNRRKPGTEDAIVWVDPQGKYSAIFLDQPLRKDGKAPTLKHLARLAINKAVKDTTPLRLLRLELPTSLTAYLAQYPYSL